MKKAMSMGQVIWQVPKHVSMGHHVACPMPYFQQISYFFSISSQTDFLISQMFIFYSPLRRTTRQDQAVNTRTVSFRFNSSCCRRKRSKCFCCLLESHHIISKLQCKNCSGKLYMARKSYIDSS